jgi:hypothetical protein
MDGGMTALAEGVKKLISSAPDDEETLQSVIERILSFFSSKKLTDAVSIRGELKTSIYEELRGLENKTGRLHDVSLDLLDVCDNLLYTDTVLF